MLLTYFCKETDGFYQKEEKEIGDGEYYYLLGGGIGHAFASEDLNFVPLGYKIRHHHCANTHGFKKRSK